MSQHHRNPPAGPPPPSPDGRRDDAIVVNDPYDVGQFEGKNPIGSRMNDAAQHFYNINDSEQYGRFPVAGGYVGQHEGTGNYQYINFGPLAPSADSDGQYRDRRHAGGVSGQHVGGVDCFPAGYSQDSTTSYPVFPQHGIHRLVQDTVARSPAASMSAMEYVGQGGICGLDHFSGSYPGRYVDSQSAPESEREPYLYPTNQPYKAAPFLGGHYYGPLPTPLPYGNEDSAAIDQWSAEYMSTADAVNLWPTIPVARGPTAYTAGIILATSSAATPIVQYQAGLEPEATLLPLGRSPVTVPQAPRLKGPACETCHKRKKKCSASERGRFPCDACTKMFKRLAPEQRSSWSCSAHRDGRQHNHRRTRDRRNAWRHSNFT